ncbi:hypothetical protein Zmor_018303 [Zophobas morio]|uniref:Gustatory receptor n=1 Tax=Zophobas morio TaxID=2755281 RepID=A0AA38MDR8_9CUCU|nr:hypothetical protein Zmor_018303 [Zophobas morio]
MGFRLWSFVLKFGNIFASTSLASIQYNKCKNVCNIIISIVLAVGGVLGLTIKKFYSEFNTTRRICSVVGDALLYCISFYFIIVLNFWKKHLWTSLYEGLKRTAKLSCVETTKSKIPFYCGFIIMNCGHFTVHALVLYYRRDNLGVHLLKEGVFYIEAYFDFCYKFLLCVILNMLLTRYRALNNLLQVYTKTKTDRKFSKHFLNQVEYIMGSLRKTVDVFNDMFGWPVLFMTFYTVPSVLNLINLIFFSAETYGPLEVKWIGGLLAAWFFFGVIILIIMYDRVIREAENVVTGSYELKFFMKTTGWNDLKTEESVRFLMKNSPKFTAANFFEIGRWTILSLFETIIAFTIPMIQFETVTQ